MNITHYHYNGFVLVVGANEKVLVHLPNSDGLPGKLVAQCNDLANATHWVDSPLTRGFYRNELEGDVIRSDDGRTRGAIRGL